MRTMLDSLGNDLALVDDLVRSDAMMMSCVLDLVVQAFIGSDILLRRAVLLSNLGSRVNLLRVRRGVVLSVLDGLNVVLDMMNLPTSEKVVGERCTWRSCSFCRVTSSVRWS